MYDSYFGEEVLLILQLSPQSTCTRWTHRLAGIIDPLYSNTTCTLKCTQQIQTVIWASAEAVKIANSGLWYESIVSLNLACAVCVCVAIIGCAKKTAIATNITDYRLSNVALRIWSDLTLSLVFYRSAIFPRILCYYRERSNRCDNKPSQFHHKAWNPSKVQSTYYPEVRGQIHCLLWQLNTSNATIPIKAIDTTPIGLLARDLTPPTWQCRKVLAVHPCKSCTIDIGPHAQIMQHTFCQSIYLHIARLSFLFSLSPSLQMFVAAK